MLSAVGLSTHIFNNHLKSALLLLGFPLLFLLMIGSFFASLDVLMQKSAAGKPPAFLADVLEGRTHTSSAPGGGINWQGALDSAVYGVTHYGHWALLAALAWFTIAYFFHSRMIRVATGAKPVTRAQFPKIYNMLENLCISRGITMPRFEVIDSPALNAFASGIDQKSYAITLTRGIIEALPDDELEAVIAHELTHIINRDVRLLIISVVFVGMISFFAEMAFRSLLHGGRVNYYARGRDRRGNTLPLLLVAVLILAIGYLFAIVIRFSLSRKREYLADAGAVELTKRPEPMMRALMRISGKDRVSGMPDEVQQMCIENSANFMGLFATHPSIGDRVRVLSEMTGAPIPEVTPTLRRVPKRPWDDSWGDAR